MKGWKTITGALIIGAGAALKFLGYDGIAETVMAVGGALGLVGVGHKLDKNGMKAIAILLLPMLAIGMMAGCQKDDNG